MTRKQFQELAAMLKEHRRVANLETNHRSKLERLQEINNIQDSIIGICNRNNDNFNVVKFEEAAHYTN